MTRSSATGSSRMSSRLPATRSASGGCGGCAEPSGSGPPRRRRARRHGKIPGPAVHDDLVVRRQFRAPCPDAVWVTDITEHATVERRLYCGAIKDLFSNRVVGYALDERMTAQLAVSALRSAIARRQPEDTLVVHSDRGSQFRSRAYRAVLKSAGLSGSMGRVAAAGD
jgi:putative transposase